jgi:hypothetical protein
VGDSISIAFNLPLHICCWGVQKYLYIEAASLFRGAKLTVYQRQCLYAVNVSVAANAKLDYGYDFGLNLLAQKIISKLLFILKKDLLKSLNKIELLIVDDPDNNTL